jgi:AcrR family transcriptional regulator
VAGTIGLADDRSRPRQDLVPTPVDPPRVDTGEPVKDVVLAAAAAVVARTGFERATVSRIARRAGYSTGVIYEHFDGKDDMIAALVEVLLQELYGTIADRDGTLLAAGTMAGASGSLLAGYVQPEATELQRLKVELYLTAAHQRPVADALARIIDHRTAAITERLLGLGLSAEQAAIAPFAGRAIDHGMALVDAVAGPLLDVDWRLYMQALVSRNTGPR